MIDRPALTAGLVGGLFFTWLVGFRILDPTEAGWVMRGDWQWHFLGWHLFRSEPWQLPPGRIASYLEPVGSALGYTDSIPLVAFVLKPFAAWLPNPFNYLGVWFLLNYALVGFFGALVVGTWSPHPAVRILGGSLLVLLPTLLARMAHPALASHWLLLWALWLNWRESEVGSRGSGVGSRGSGRVGQYAAVGLTSGLVHPYLAIMVLVLLLPVGLRRLITWPIAAAAVLIGWWASGLFTIRSTADLQSGGLGDFSMNLLGPITPAGRSIFLPDMPTASVEQLGEGYQYLGAGVLFLTAVAVIRLRAFRLRQGFGGQAGASARHVAVRREALPLLFVLFGLTVYAVSPRVTFGSRVWIDLVDQVGSVSMFRSTGRFFWPVAYALAAASAGFIAARFKPSVATALLAAAVILQVVDLQNFFLTVHNGARDPGFYAWSSALRSAEWHDLLPRYRRLRLHSPEICRGVTPVAVADAAYLAGLHGLSINDGFAARIDRVKQEEACARLGKEFRSGILDDSTVYLVAPSLLAEFEQHAAGAAACRVIDGVPVCVSRPVSRKP